MGTAFLGLFLRLAGPALGLVATVSGLSAVLLASAVVVLSAAAITWRVTNKV